VLLVEIEDENRLRPLLGLPDAAGHGPEELLSNLHRQSVGGRAALEEYLAMVIPVRRVLRVVFESRVYQYFVAAAPGLKELMTVGKIWYEVEQGRWDLVVVDCPATGHSLQYLRMPKVAHDTFPSGLVHREAGRVWKLLCDARQTGVVVVTIAEEMPVNETLEICSQLDDELGLPRGALVLNRFHETAVTVADVERATPSRKLPPEESALVEAVRSRARELASWGELNAHNRRRLESRHDWPMVVLPFLFREEFSLGDVELLAARLDETLGGTSAAARRARPEMSR
jgi:anion-transporting  ArsA/GET3 family ATPase